jgi:alpha-ketoglutarate-dependent 2,4-dichlorophenoxyacetate dioxygenase
MPGRIQEPQFQPITVKEIGPTFAAEVEGVDFSQEIPQEVFDEILGAITEVSCLFLTTAAIILTFFL